MTTLSSKTGEIEIVGPVTAEFAQVLTPDAMKFVATLVRTFSGRREELLQKRAQRQAEIDAGKMPDFLPETEHIRQGSWTIAPVPADLQEKHVLIDGKEIPGGLFDFGLYFFHNVKSQLGKGTGPYFYLPKLESHLEARLWNDVFVLAQNELGIPLGTIKATVLIETILASFEMDEILYELREHSSGLNCGRWDYIFSAIKKFRNIPVFLYPDRAQVTMTTHFMRSYSLLTIKTCHRRNAHAIGGMAAQIPIKSDPKANEEAMSKVRADKHREANDGHDGTWVAHPGLVAVAMEEFNKVMPGPNQIDKKREDVHEYQRRLAVPGILARWPGLCSHQ